MNPTPGKAPGPYREPLHELAARAGILVDWNDAHGRPRRVADDVLRTVLDALELPAGTPAQARDSLARLRREDMPGALPLLVIDAGAAFDLPRAPSGGFLLEDEDGRRHAGTAASLGNGRARLPGIVRPGYYRLSMGQARYRLAVAPRCPSVREAAGTASRLWGVAAQVYSLRRGEAADPAQGMGYGDFGALAALARASGRQGATALAISPVHAMFSADPGRCSPYSPSSRLFLNALYGDPAAVLGGEAVATALRAHRLGERALRLEALDLIDWPRAGALRLELLHALHASWRGSASSALREDFLRYREAGGEALESHARFEALHALAMAAPGGSAGWRDWPQALRDPAGAAVRDYAAAHEEEVEFHAFAQWIAARSLEGAQRAARDSGMRIGLIADLAVGADPDGSHAWSRQADILRGLSPGAPGDLYHPGGQAWNLTAFSPRRLRQDGYRAYIEMLRAALAHAGGLRVDHALGLARMWLVPDGAAPSDGAYLRYPLDDMLRLIALEAWRRRAIVVGENLGTVPAGFDPRIARAGMLGTDVLWFARGPAGACGVAPFLPPGQWPAHAVAATTTHDLPTVAGWWLGRDLDWRRKLGLPCDGESGPDPRERRQAERAALWEAVAGPAAGEPPPRPPLEAILGHVADTPCPLTLAPLEDLLGLEEQANLPGTVDGHPNWRRRLPVAAQRIYDAPGVGARRAALARGRSPA